MTKRFAIIWGSVLAAVVIAATIVIVVVLNANTAANQEADYRACVAAEGLYESTSVDDMAGMADTCYRSVYGKGPLD